MQRLQEKEAPFPSQERRLSELKGLKKNLKPIKNIKQDILQANYFKTPNEKKRFKRQNRLWVNTIKNKKSLKKIVKLDKREKRK